MGQSSAFFLTWQQSKVGSSYLCQSQLDPTLWKIKQTESYSKSPQEEACVGISLPLPTIGFLSWTFKKLYYTGKTKPTRVQQKAHSPTFLSLIIHAYSGLLMRKQYEC